MGLNSCRALFLIRLYAQSGFDGSFTASCLRKWNIQPGSANPPSYVRIPATMGYLRCFIAGDAYMPMRGGTEVDKSYKRRLYSTLKELSDNAAPPQEMRIVKKWPTVDWKAVLRNLVETPSLESDIVHWYNVIHDVIPTNERLQCIRISPTDGCNVCDRKVTLSHRLKECGEGRDT